VRIETLKVKPTTCLSRNLGLMFLLHSQIRRGAILSRPQKLKVSCSNSSSSDCCPSPSGHVSSHMHTAIHHDPHGRNRVSVVPQICLTIITSSPTFRTPVKKWLLLKANSLGRLLFVRVRHLMVVGDLVASTRRSRSGVRPPRSAPALYVQPWLGYGPEDWSQSGQASASYGEAQLKG
jgi:hypothetical protein